MEPKEKMEIMKRIEEERFCTMRKYGRSLDNNKVTKKVPSREEKNRGKRRDQTILFYDIMSSGIC